MKIKEALFDKVLVEMLPKEELKSQGGIFIESSSNEGVYHGCRAIIRHIGPCAFKEYKEAGLPYPQEGSLVLLTKYAGENCEDFTSSDKAKVCRVVRDLEILGVLDD